MHLHVVQESYVIPTPYAGCSEGWDHSWYDSYAILPHRLFCSASNLCSNLCRLLANEYLRMQAIDLETRLKWVQAHPQSDARKAGWLSDLAKQCYSAALENLKGYRLDLADACIEMAQTAGSASPETVQINLLALAIQRVRLKTLQQERAAAAVPFEDRVRRAQQEEAAKFLAELPAAPRHMPEQ